jgi:hypothetical protein
MKSRAIVSKGAAPGSGAIRYKEGFGHLTCTISFYIFSDIVSDGWLLVIFSNEKHGFRDSGVSCSSKVMVEGNYFPLKAIMFHYNEMRTKKSMTIGEREVILGGESLQGLRMSLLLPNDIPVKVQGQESINKDKRGKIHFLGKGRQTGIIRVMEKTICMVEDARLVFDREVILYQAGNGMLGIFTKFVRVVIVAKINVVRVNSNLIAKKKVLPLLKSMIDSGKLFIIDIIVSFSIREYF